MVIQSKSFPSVEVYRTEYCGWGLRVTEDVPEGAVIIEYLGEVITSSTLMERMAEYDANHDFYFASLDKGLILDAKAMGSTARFANHSCDPTCELQKWTVVGEIRIVLVSKKTLAAGTPVTYNYNYFDDGLDDLLDIERQVCRCGAVNCSGTIGGKVIAETESDQWKCKAISLLSGRKKQSIDAFEQHLREIPNANYRTSSEYLAISDLLSKAYSIREDIRNIFKFKFVKDSSDDIDVAQQSAATVSNVQPSNETNGVVSQGPSDTMENVADVVAATKDCEEAENVDWMVDIDCAQGILDKVPKAVRLDEALKLTSFIKRAVQADRYILQLRDILNPPPPRQKASAVTVDVDVEVELAAAEDAYSADNIESAVIVQSSSSNIDIDPSSNRMSSSSIAPTKLLAISSDDQSPEPVLAQSIASPATTKELTKSSKQEVLKGSNNSTGTDSKSQRLAWEGLMHAFKEVTSVLPIKCRNAQLIMDLYDEVNNYARKYTKHLLLPRKFNHVPPVQWNYVEKVFRYYNPYASSFSKSDLFLQLDFFETRYSLYMNRLKNQGVDIVTLQQKSIPLADLYNGEDEEKLMECKLHCYCQMVETNAEFNVLSECDSCKRWYHPQCTNSVDLSASAMSRTGEFQCPTCLLRDGLPNMFTYEPLSEWNLTARASRCSSGGRSVKARVENNAIDDSTQNTSTIIKSDETNMQVDEDSKGQGGVDHFKVDNASNVEVIDTAVVENSTQLDGSEVINAGAAISVKQGTKRQRNKTRIKIPQLEKKKGLFSLSDIEEAIAAEKSLRVTEVR